MTNGLVGTAVSLAVLGVGIGLFAQGINRAQRSLDDRPRQRRSANGNRNRRQNDIFDPMPQRQQKRRPRRNNDVFNMDFF